MSLIGGRWCELLAILEFTWDSDGTAGLLVGVGNPDGRPGSEVLWTAAAAGSEELL